MRIFYVVAGGHVAGGQLVNLEHVETLRSFGYDARYLVLKPEAVTPDPKFPPGREVPWETDPAELTADDFVVVGEMFGFGAVKVQHTPARKLIHNQNPFYSFMAFRDLDAVRGWGCEAILCPSSFTASQLRAFGWEGPLHVIRPAIDPAFAAAPQQRDLLRIVFMPRKRRIEAPLIRGIFLSKRPDLAEKVRWVEIDGRPRHEVAHALGASDLFLSLSYAEGLGLPPLEAMAAGSLVVGFHGGGGLDYATAENGDWFDDGQAVAIAERLAERVDQLIAGETFAARRAAGRRTAAGFNPEAFRAALRSAWEAIAGPP